MTLSPSLAFGITALAAFAAALVTWLFMRSRLAVLQALLGERTAEVERLRDSNESIARLANERLASIQHAATEGMELRHQRIDELVRPVQDGLSRLESVMHAVDRDRAESHATLHEQLRQLAVTHQALSGSTRNLVHALRTPHGRGRWGEMQLRRVVELAGMLEHCDFEEQASFSGENGRLRPDLLVHLPGHKVMVVDSKAPMSAYLDALDATDDAHRTALLDRHARHVRNHVEQLAARDYASELTDAPDFVFMFLPGEDFFVAACQRDPSLLEYAMSLGVIPASPTTLISMLKAVAYGWQQERIAERAEEVRDLGQMLYQRMAMIVEHLDRMRKSLESTVGAYNNMIGSLETRVLPVARRFRDLGLGSDAEIAALQPLESIPRNVSAHELIFAVDDDVGAKVTSDMMKVTPLS